MTSSNYANHTMYQQIPLKVSDSFSCIVNTTRFFEQLLTRHNHTILCKLPFTHVWFN